MLWWTEGHNVVPLVSEGPRVASPIRRPTRHGPRNCTAANLRVGPCRSTHGGGDICIVVYVENMEAYRDSGNRMKQIGRERHVTTETRGDRLQKTSSVAGLGLRRAQATGFEGDDDKVSAWNCRSTRISGCHEAAETRTIRVKNRFSNGMSPQPHRLRPPS